MKIKRGQVYYADLSGVVGSEQGGVRPVVILQNDMGNKYSSTFIIAPITSGKRNKLPVHCPLHNAGFLRKGSIVLLEQLRTIDKDRLLTYLGRLNSKVMNEISNMSIISLGLVEEYNFEK